MTTTNCVLTLEQIIEIAMQRGLRGNDVMESQLAHLVHTCRIQGVRLLCDKKTEQLYAIEVTDSNDGVLTAEKFLADLPLLLSDLAECMEEAGGLNMERGLQNWAVVEAIMAEHDPEIKAAIEQRDSPGAFTRH